MEKKNIFLSSNLRFLRMVKGKTQQEVADYCDKANTAISNWEKGIREPDALDLAKLSDFFNVPIDDLMLKDLRIKGDTFDELEILFDKHKDILTEDDKEYIKFIIEKRKKEIDKELGEE